jgi:hypothetical protein
VNDRGVEGTFTSTPGSRLALRSTQTPGALSLGVKWPGHEADHSSPSSDQVKNGCSYISTPQYIFREWYLIQQIHLHDMVLGEAQGQLCLYIALQIFKKICNFS